MTKEKAINYVGPATNFTQEELIHILKQDLKIIKQIFIYQGNSTFVGHVIKVGNKMINKRNKGGQ